MEEKYLDSFEVYNKIKDIHNEVLKENIELIKDNFDNEEDKKAFIACYSETLKSYSSKDVFLFGALFDAIVKDNCIDIILEYEKKIAELVFYKEYKEYCLYKISKRDEGRKKWKLIKIA